MNRLMSGFSTIVLLNKVPNIFRVSLMSYRIHGLSFSQLDLQPIPSQTSGLFTTLLSLMSSPTLSTCRRRGGPGI